MFDSVSAPTLGILSCERCESIIENALILCDPAGPPSAVTHPRLAEVACIPDALRSGKDLSACFAVFSLLHSQFFPSTTGSTRDKKNISMLMSGKGLMQRLNSIKFKSLVVNSWVFLALTFLLDGNKVAYVFMQRNVPRGLTPYLLVQDRLILSKAHHSNPSTCTKVVKILTYNQLYPIWKR